MFFQKKRNRAVLIAALIVAAGLLVSCEDSGAGSSGGSGSGDPVAITFTGATDYVARYTFDTSDFADSTGNHPFTTNTGEYNTENAKIGAGCAYYNGSTYSATASNISMSGGAYTFAFWAKIDKDVLSSINLYNYMGTVSIDDFYPAMDKNSYMRTIVPSESASSSENAKCDYAISDVDSWHHYVFTVEDNTSGNASIPIYYCDGVLLDDTHKFDSGFIVEDSTTARLKVGYPPYQSYYPYFSGYMDDVIFYDRALSETEVTELYSSF